MKPTSQIALLLGSALAAAAVYAEAPPSIPSGPITYTDVSGQTDFAEDGFGRTDMRSAAPASKPRDVSAYSEKKFASLSLNAYTSNYQVRGMGVSNLFSDAGWSSVDLKLRPGSSNLFGMGIGQQIDLTAGAIYGSGILGNEPVLGASYGLSKEIFPNLWGTVGYRLQYGGLEGFLADYRGKTSHQLAQNFHINLRYDDRQQGFFGQIDLGAGFYGLTGWYGLLEGGYRWQDIIPVRGNIGWDAALKAGLSYSLGYWTGNADGVDAYYLRFEALPYNMASTFGRDSKWQVVPWVQTSWSGNNRSRINHALGTGLVDQFQFTVGMDIRYDF